MPKNLFFYVPAAQQAPGNAFVKEKRFVANLTNQALAQCFFGQHFYQADNDCIFVDVRYVEGMAQDENLCRQLKDKEIVLVVKDATSLAGMTIVASQTVGTDGNFVDNHVPIQQVLNTLRPNGWWVCENTDLPDDTGEDEDDYCNAIENAINELDVVFQTLQQQNRDKAWHNALWVRRAAYTTFLSAIAAFIFGSAGFIAPITLVGTVVFAGATIISGVFLLAAGIIRVLEDYSHSTQPSFAAYLKTSVPLLFENITKWFQDKKNRPRAIGMGLLLVFGAVFWPLAGMSALSFVGDVVTATFGVFGLELGSIAAMAIGGVFLILAPLFLYNAVLSFYEEKDAWLVWLKKHKAALIFTAVFLPLATLVVTAVFFPEALTTAGNWLASQFTILGGLITRMGANISLSLFGSTALSTVCAIIVIVLAALLIVAIVAAIEATRTHFSKTPQEAVAALEADYSTAQALYHADRSVVHARIAMHEKGLNVAKAQLLSVQADVAAAAARPPVLAPTARQLPVNGAAPNIFDDIGDGLKNCKDKMVTVISTNVTATAEAFKNMSFFNSSVRGVSVSNISTDNSPLGTNISNSGNSGSDDDDNAPNTRRGWCNIL